MTAELAVISITGINIIQAIASLKLANVSIITAPGAIPRQELYIPHKQLLKLWKKLINIAHPCGVNAWELLEIMAGIPEIYPRTKNMLLPHYINLPALNAVSFTKGCYRGQEIIARMQYRATIKRHLVMGKIQKALGSANDLLPGDLVYQLGDNSTPVGTIIRLAHINADFMLVLLELADAAINFSLVTVYLNPIYLPVYPTYDSIKPIK